MSGEISTGGYNNKNIIVTEDGKKYKKAGLAASTGAVMAANACGGIVRIGVQRLGSIPMEGALKDAAKLDADVFKKAATTAFEKSGLVEKGVKLVDATVENKALVADAVEKSIPGWIKKIPPLKAFLQSKLKIMQNMVIDGKNAFFTPKANMIIVNQDKMAWASFHEMGHAMNKHMGGFGKVLSKVRTPFLFLSLAATLTALFKRKKADGEKPKNGFDRATTFIKNNCGKLAFLGMLPTLLEEGLASFKGSKLAKGLISSDQLKTLNKFHGKAWLTYLASAVGMGLTAYTISTVRDSIAHPKEINAQTKD